MEDRVTPQMLVEGEGHSEVRVTVRSLYLAFDTVCADEPLPGGAGQG